MRSICVALALLATSAQAQVQGSFSIQSINAQPSGAFGTVVAAVGDVDGDAVSDLLVGAYGERWQGAPSGRAYVHSGADGRLLYALRSPSPAYGGAFGIAVAGLGDVDRDGVVDFAVGAPEEGSGGHVHVFSGASGGLIRTLGGGLGAVAFGYAIADAGDVDGDGAADVLVGDYKRSGSNVGGAQVLSGASGGVLYALTPPAVEPNLHFGRAVAAGRDVTGDGTPDWAVAARNENAGATDAGRVHVFDGGTGTLAFSVESPTPSTGGMFGLSVALCPDLDGDGTGDLVVGAGRESATVAEEGRAYVFSGTTRALLHPLRSPNPTDGGWFGQNVVSVGDVDSDGVSDVAVGAIGESHGAPSSGTVYVFSGASGLVVGQLASPAPETGGRLGIFAAPVVDVDAGTTRAIAVGAYYEDAPAMDAGAVHVLPVVVGVVSTGPPVTPTETRLGPPRPNPASGPVTLALVIAERDDVEVVLVDVRGRTLVRRALGHLPAGVHSVPVETGGLAPGTYVVRVRIGDQFVARPVGVVRGGERGPGWR
ncbi:MAG TPA: FG-GAP-like repeat-containing protein [Rubricoccaceae bacterium]